MEDIKKVLHMTFATKEGGTFKISVSNTLDDLSSEQVKEAMDAIVDASVFTTNKGEVVRKAKAYFVTQEVEELDIA